MSFRTVVVSKSSKLEYSLGFLVVRNIESTSKIHLSEISILMVENTATGLTTALLCELVKKKIKVIFCDEKHNPISELTPYYGSHDCSLKLKDQIKWDTTLKQQLWTEIVSQKIRNQARVLDKYNLTQSKMLYDYIDELEFNDKSNREGHAAKVYFNALFGKSFSRTQDIPLNAALNFGYSLILSCFNREIVASGYLTQLGLFHDNMFNQYNLSCDLMEPLRPYIDNYVKALNPTKFDKEEKQKILSALNGTMIIDSLRNTCTNAIKFYCKSVFESLSNNNVLSVKFIEYEL